MSNVIKNKKEEIAGDDVDGWGFRQTGYNKKVTSSSKLFTLRFSLFA